MARRITLDRARRIALAAQGLAESRPSGRVDVRHFRKVLDRLSVCQLDSVNVAARAHYLPFFSRLGSYDRGRLDRWLWESGENFEYWGHEASVMPMRLHRLMRHRMTGVHPWRSVQRLFEEHPGYVEEVRRLVEAAGPLSVSDLESAGSRSGSWWGWNRGRVALDWLYVAGHVAVHHRDRGFRIHYDLPERVIPATVRNEPAAERPDADRELLTLALRGQGLGTAPDLADHFRIPIRRAREALADLVLAGEAEEVAVPGWKGPVYVDPSARTPRQITGGALLSPFDPLVWFRPRVERLFGFRYRIEIYVPRDRREYGYYVLPFLLDGELVARVDVKADRQARTLRVPGAFVEEGRDGVRVARELRAELETMASWLGLDRVEVGRRGNLADLLRAEMSK